MTPLTDAMKPTRNSPEFAPLLAFGAHPDDIEFGCGGVIASETHAGRQAHFVVCSRGEAGTHGTPKQRVAEAKKSAGLLGATILISTAVYFGLAWMLRCEELSEFFLLLRRVEQNPVQSAEIGYQAF